ncbi:hypothetical protein GT204_03370 [Streptomyces sp. SID4919]|uniref:hypothetical protein n=1 Tax=unclassified Streptomyces TaxID=2593676 RepID=UPI000823A602|nr:MULTISPECIES: hypothetical protein [unclassified Streptomyces]MYY07962.1 hypothetical protein [Streptomyces sp. SID4919]SCK07467.1 hypothetical protein YW7DRAFT_00270 [Streptomyces sp. AmelKG-E11A]
MDAERARRMVAALRERGVMAHLVEAGVYEFGIRVVLDTDMEALWDVDGAAGLDAEIVSEGVLVGFVPHVPGSEDFSEERLVDTIATTVYDPAGLSPPADGTSASGHPPAPGRNTGTPSPGTPPPAAPPVARYQRRGHWLRRNRH